MPSKMFVNKKMRVGDYETLNFTFRNDQLNSGHRQNNIQVGNEVIIKDLDYHLKSGDKFTKGADFSPSSSIGNMPPIHIIQD